MSIIFLFQTVLPASAGQDNVWSDRQRAAERNKETNSQMAKMVSSAKASNEVQLLAALPSMAPGLRLPFSPQALSDLGIRTDTPSPEKRHLTESVVPKWFQTAIAPYSTIHEIHLSKRPNAKTVFIMQDVHLHYEAQMNIALALDAVGRELKKKNKQMIVGMEGAKAGKMDFKPYSDFTNRTILRQLARGMMKAHILNGVEFAAIGYMGDKKGGPVDLPFDIRGVETWDLYKQNVRALRSSTPFNEEAKIALQDLNKELSALKTKHFNKELLVFSSKLSEYQEGVMGLSEYALHLNSIVPAQGAQIKRFVETALLEKSINFGRVESERTSFLENLLSKLSQGEIKELIQLSSLFKSGVVGPSGYFGELKKRAAQHGVFLARYPELARYVLYVAKTESIDHEGLFAELKKEEQSVSAHLAQTPSQREVLSLINDRYTLRKLSQHILTEDEWQDYSKRADSVRNIAERITSLEGKASSSVKKMSSRWTLFEDFYRSAEARNKAMTSNLFTDLEDSNTASLFLVAGGFHTPGLTTEIMERGENVIVMSPKITGVDESASSLDLLASNQLPLDKVFVGEKLFLPLPAQASRNGASELTVLTAEAISKFKQTGGRVEVVTSGGVPITIDNQKSVPGDELMKVDLDSDRLDGQSESEGEVDDVCAWFGKAYDYREALLMSFIGKPQNDLTRFFLSQILRTSPFKKYIGLNGSLLSGKDVEFAYSLFDSSNINGWHGSGTFNARGSSRQFGVTDLLNFFSIKFGQNLIDTAFIALAKKVLISFHIDEIKWSRELFQNKILKKGDPAVQSKLIEAMSDVLVNFGFEVDKDFKVELNDEMVEGKAVKYARIVFSGKAQKSKLIGLEGRIIQVDLFKGDPLGTMAYMNGGQGVHVLKVSEEFIEQHVKDRLVDFMAHEFTEGVLGKIGSRPYIHILLDEKGLGPDVTKVSDISSIGDRVEEIVLSKLDHFEYEAVNFFENRKKERKEEAYKAAEAARKAAKTQPVAPMVTVDPLIKPYEDILNSATIPSLEDLKRTFGEGARGFDVNKKMGMVALSIKNNIFVYDRRKGQVYSPGQGQLYDDIRLLKFSPDGARLFSFDSVGYSTLWDLPAAFEICQMQLSLERQKESNPLGYPDLRKKIISYQNHEKANVDCLFRPIVEKVAFKDSRTFELTFRAKPGQAKGETALFHVMFDPKEKQFIPKEVKDGQWAAWIEESVLSGKPVVEMVVYDGKAQVRLRNFIGTVKTDKISGKKTPGEIKFLAGTQVSAVSNVFTKNNETVFAISTYDPDGNPYVRIYNSSLKELRNRVTVAHPLTVLYYFSQGELLMAGCHSADSLANREGHAILLYPKGAKFILRDGKAVMVYGASIAADNSVDLSFSPFGSGNTPPVNIKPNKDGDWVVSSVLILAGLTLGYFLNGPGGMALAAVPFLRIKPKISTEEGAEESSVNQHFRNVMAQIFPNVHLRLDQKFPNPNQRSPLNYETSNELRFTNGALWREDFDALVANRIKGNSIWNRILGQEKNPYQVEVAGGIEAQSAFTRKSVDPVVVDESETLEHIEQLVSRLAGTENKIVVLPLLMTIESFDAKLIAASEGANQVEKEASQKLLSLMKSGQLELVGLTEDQAPEAFSNDTTPQINPGILDTLLIEYSKRSNIERKTISSVSIMSARPLAINRNHALLMGIQIIRLVIAMEVEVIDLENRIKTEQIVFIQA